MNILGVTLFNSAGTSEISRLEPLSVQWLDELDAEGSFSMQVSYETGDAIEIGNIIKFAFGSTSNSYVFAGVVESLTVTKTDLAKTVNINGRGIRALLADAIVYNTTSDNVRFFSAVSAGEIFKTLFDEAQVRNALPGMSLSFSDSLDSNGDAYTESLTLDVQVGTTLLDVSREHGELAVDVYVTPDLEVEYYNARGEDLTIVANPVVLRVGSNISELTNVVAGPIKNKVLVGSGDSGTTYTTVTDASSVSSYGVKETFISLANTTNAGQITLATDRLLLNVAEPSDGITIDLDMSAALPYIDFNVGDYVFLADDTGTRVKYRVRGLTFTQDSAGNISVVPELGTIRADLDKRLARLLNRGERGKAEGISDVGPIVGYTPGDLDTGGASFDVGTVVSYDPLTGEGVIDINGDEFSFINGSGFSLNPGDELITTTIGQDLYAIGYETNATFGSHELVNYIVPSSVAGTPRIPPTEMVTSNATNFNYLASGTDFVAYQISDNNMLQVNISTGTSVTYTVTGGGVRPTYTNGTTCVGTNAVDDIYFVSGGILTTVNYAGATRIKLAGYDATLGYCFAVQSTTFCKAVQVHESTGVHTVTDITSTFPAFTGRFAVARCGGGYFIIWNGANKTAAGNSLGMWVYDGTTQVIYSSIDSTTGINSTGVPDTSSPLYVAATGQGTASLGRLDMEDGYLYWVFNQTGFYKMDLATGTLTLYNNIFPVAFDTVGTGASARIVTIAAIDAGTVVIAGARDELPIFFITDGVTTTQVVPTGLTSNAAHFSIAAGNGSVGYVYYQLNSAQDFIVGATV